MNGVEVKWSANTAFCGCSVAMSFRLLSALYWANLFDALGEQTAPKRQAKNE